MRFPIWPARVACGAYLVALTTLLLAKDPMLWLFGLVPDGSVPTRGAHFCAFFLLAILTAASRLPWRVSIQAGALIAYAIVIESLQALVDARTVELLDYAENLLGLAAGLLTWKLAQATRAARP